MSISTRIINITPENVFNYKPGPSCFVSPAQEGAQKKLAWMKQRFKEGLTIKVLYMEDLKKSAGFIEYIPGEYAWRAVDAPGYFFIHCIWIYPNDQKNKGYASRLLQTCIDDARSQDKLGVAVVTREGAFMAGKSLFLKNEFSVAEKEQPDFHLLVHQLKDGPLPRFRNWQYQLKKLEGLHFLYSNQCPWVARSISELSQTASKFGLTPTITEITSAKQAQNAPSVYSTFNLIFNGKLLADHYISKRRFENIIKKEIKTK